MTMTHDEFVARTLRADWPLPVLFLDASMGLAMHCTSAEIIVQMMVSPGGERIRGHRQLAFDRVEASGVLLLERAERV
jgi:hypothetical protein